MSSTDPMNEGGWDRGIRTVRVHSTPDPDVPSPAPNPTPDDVPAPVHAPVQEPTFPEPPIKAGEYQR